MIPLPLSVDWRKKMSSVQSVKLEKRTLSISNSRLSYKNKREFFCHRHREVNQCRTHQTSGRPRVHEKNNLKNIKSQRHCISALACFPRTSVKRDGGAIKKYCEGKRERKSNEEAIAHARPFRERANDEEELRPPTPSALSWFTKRSRINLEEIFPRRSDTKSGSARACALATFRELIYASCVSLTRLPPLFSGDTSAYS